MLESADALETNEAAEIPNILWEEREQYESEGQLAFFTDCGLYKDGTDELTGAKCEFTDGDWVLLEPQLEPGDNLIENGDFIELPVGIGDFDDLNLQNWGIKHWTTKDVPDFDTIIKVDENKNNKWDTGNYLKKQLPEIILYHKQINNAELRANYFLEESFIID